jgi:aromatic-L-amino-acid/L-tryptophan decarboxylase
MQRSEVGNVGLHLARIGAELDRFLEFRDGDAVRRRDTWTSALERPLPEAGIGAQAVVDELAETVIPNGARMAAPGFSSWITTGPDTVAVVAAAAASLAAPQRYTITAFNLLEELSLDWLAELCGLRCSDGGRMQGVYSSGGSVANLVALGAARQWAFEQAGIDPAADGLGGRELALYASVESHHTVPRSAAVLGIGRSRVRLIATDEQQRMRVDLLRRALEEDVSNGVLPVAVVSTAGTTSTGAIDPLCEAGELAREHGAWYHVDGAYGLLGCLDGRIAELYDGLELADSAIVDPHKWLGAPVGIAATFVRDRSILHRAFTQEPAPYLEAVFGDSGEVQTSLDSLGIPYADFAVELSSPSRGVVVWSVIRELGREGVQARIRRDNDYARRVAELVRQHARLELITEPVLSICCFRYAVPGIDDLNAFNAALLRRLIRETPYAPSSTLVGGTYVIRPCYINARTNEEHVDGLVAAVVALCDELAQPRST